MCDIRCKTAETPASNCNCDCNGENHGTQTGLQQALTGGISK